MKEDLGFNSHGARNLGMQQSTTNWNFLTDVDNDIGCLDFQKIFDLPFDNNDVYSFHTNSIILNKTTYWSCKGYDEEYVGVHYGDRYFLNYLQTNFDFYNITNNDLPKLRHGWVVRETKGIDRDQYQDGILYMKPLDHEKNLKIHNMIKDRYEKNNFTNKKIINFEWEQVICS